jgi:hypothetical protein
LALNSILSEMSIISTSIQFNMGGLIARDGMPSAFHCYLRIGIYPVHFGRGVLYNSTNLVKIWMNEFYQNLIQAVPQLQGSRTQVGRWLDPGNTSIMLSTPQRAADVTGHRLVIGFGPISKRRPAAAVWRTAYLNLKTAVDRSFTFATPHGHSVFCLR